MKQLIEAARPTAGRLHEIVLDGHCPTKKNNYRIANRGLRVEDETKAYIDWLLIQARRQWIGRKPIESATIKARFYVRDGRADLDGKFTTVQDVLVKAGVLRNDSIARLRRIEAEAIIDADECVQIEIREAA